MKILKHKLRTKRVKYKNVKAGEIMVDTNGDLYLKINKVNLPSGGNVNYIKLNGVNDNTWGPLRASSLESENREVRVITNAKLVIGDGLKNKL